MQPTSYKGKLWAGRIMSILVILFLTMDAAMKLMKTEPSIEGSLDLGYSTDHLFSMGLILIICTILYAIPKTSVFGAILLTGYLGGAVATHYRLFNPLFSHTLFPVYMGVLVWGGLLLRYNQLKIILPWKEGK